MTFAVDETSVEGSQPRTLLAIAHGTTRYYIATGDRDVILGSITYTATPGLRSELLLQQATATVNLTISLPSNHPLVRRYVALGSPPSQILVTVLRYQLSSGEYEQTWVGYVTSLALTKHEARFLVPSRTQQALQRKLPTVLLDELCQNILYDGWCKVVRASYTIASTVSGVNGRVVTVASMSGQPDGWADGGELVHVPSGEPMGILTQIGNVITMRAPIFELAGGDAVQVSAGCNHKIQSGCRDKFGNVPNFVGMPNRPTRDLFIPTGIGTGTST